MAEILTIVEAAAYIGCKPATLRAWKAHGRGPRYYRAGRLIRYRRTDLDDWILDQLAASPASSGNNGTEESEDAHVTNLPDAALGPPATNATYCSATNSRLALLRRRRRLNA